MRELGSDECKKIMAAILEDVDAFCEKMGLRYYIMDGTLLGAIRHQGFIPWDDDVDIAMPRKDYELFLQNYPSSGKYRIVNDRNTPDYYLGFSKVIDDDTVLTEEIDNAVPLGVYIDLFPLDNIGSNYKQACKTYRHLWFYHKLLSTKMYRNHEKENGTGTYSAPFVSTCRSPGSRSSVKSNRSHGQEKEKTTDMWRLRFR